MSRYKHKRVFTIPAAKLEAVNNAVGRLGLGFTNFSIPLSDTRVREYACSWVLTDEELAVVKTVLASNSGEEHVPQSREKPRTQIDRVAAAKNYTRPRPTPPRQRFR